MEYGLKKVPFWFILNLHVTPLTGKSFDETGENNIAESEGNKQFPTHFH
jgi:hypothetical protein